MSLPKQGFVDIKHILGCTPLEDARRQYKRRLRKIQADSNLTAAERTEATARLVAEFEEEIIQLRFEEEIPPTIPIAPSTWWDGVRNGRYPQPVKHFGRTFWRVEDIVRLLEEIGHTGDAA